MIVNLLVPLLRVLIQAVKQYIQLVDFILMACYNKLRR